MSKKGAPAPKEKGVRFSLEINVLVSLHCSIVLEQHTSTRAHFKDSRFIHHKGIYVGVSSVAKRYFYLNNIKIMMLHKNIRT